MSRAFIRLRPDGIYEIVSPLPARKREFALGALLVLSTLGLASAAGFSAFLGTARALLGGAALSMLILLGILVRSRLRSAASPLAVTLPLRPTSPPGTSAPHAGGARDTGA